MSGRYDWPTIIDEVCAWLATGGTIRAYCRQPGKPGHVAVYEHVGTDEAASERIVRARARGADAIAEEALEIADDSSGDTIETEHGARCDNEWVQRSKLRFEARMRLLAKWNSGRYGDKQQVEHSGTIGDGLTEEQRTQRIAEILRAGKARKVTTSATQQSGPVDGGAAKLSRNP